MLRLAPEVRGASLAGSIGMAASMVATVSPAANTAGVASVGVVARADRNRPKEDVETSSEII